MRVQIIRFAPNGAATDGRVPNIVAAERLDGWISRPNRLQWRRSRRSHDEGYGADQRGGCRRGARETPKTHRVDPSVQINIVGAVFYQYSAVYIPDIVAAACWVRAMPLRESVDEKCDRRW